MEGEDRLPFLPGSILEEADMGLAGIVNKNVDRTAGFSNFVEEAGGRSLLTEISDEGPAVNAVGRELVSCLLQQVFSLPAGNDKIVSGGGQAGSDGTADSAGSTGDQCGLIFHKDILSADLEY